MNKLSRSDLFRLECRRNIVSHKCRSINQAATVSAALAANLLNVSLYRSSNKIRARVAYDFGSADFKGCVLTFKDGVPSFNFLKPISVNLGDDLNTNKGTLSPYVQDRAIRAIQQLFDAAAEYGVSDSYGIGTEVFRKAKNGQVLLEKINSIFKIPLSILSQEEEGRLGFLAGVSCFGSISLKDLVLVDVGSLSVQITGNVRNETYGLNIGTCTISKMFAEEVRYQKYYKETIYGAVTFNEIIKLSEVIIKKIKPPLWLIKRADSDATKLCTLCYKDMIDGIHEVIPGNILTVNNLEEGLKKITEPGFTFSDDRKNFLQYRLFCLTLYYSLMTKLKIKEISLGVNDGGLSPGLAVVEKYWKKD